MTINKDITKAYTLNIDATICGEEALINTTKSVGGNTVDVEIVITQENIENCLNTYTK